MKPPILNSTSYIYILRQYAIPYLSAYLQDSGPNIFIYALASWIIENIAKEYI